jgi:hypothetical protein
MFVKKLAGRTDIEDALQRLERVTVEEARMAGAEALKAIHGVGNKVGEETQGLRDEVKTVKGLIQGVGDLLQGVDGRVKCIGDFVTIGT